MSRINNNVPSLIAARIYNNNYKSLNMSLQRLSTGLRINSGKDDPAGLIASEQLRSEITAIKSAQYNIVRADNVVSVAESGLNEINRLLTELEDLIVKSSNEAGITDDEVNANQSQIDAILASINRIANSTEFLGKKLLSGALDYTTSAVASGSVDDVQIYGARIPNDGYRTVNVEVTLSAQLAALSFTGTSLSASVTLEVSGNQGTEVFSFASGATVSAIAAAINQVTELTGVSASITAGGLDFNSTEYGSKQFVSVQALTGTFTVTGGDAGTDRDFGRDATVLINGTQAVSAGLEARMQTSALSLKLVLNEALGGNTGATTFYVTGGGADFMISPTVSLNGLESIGIQSVATSSLGNRSVGFLSSIGSGQENALATENTRNAQRILREAQVQVAELRGRLGAFQKNILESMANALDITRENTVAAESAIRDTDFAAETSNLTRSQILVQSATNTLRLANSQPQSILALLQ